MIIKQNDMPVQKYIYKVFTRLYMYVYSTLLGFGIKIFFSYMNKLEIFHNSFSPFRNNSPQYTIILKGPLHFGMKYFGVKNFKIFPKKKIWENLKLKRSCKEPAKIMINSYDG